MAQANDLQSDTSHRHVEHPPRLRRSKGDHPTKCAQRFRDPISAASSHFQQFIRLWYYARLFVAEPTLGGVRSASLLFWVWMASKASGRSRCRRCSGSAAVAGSFLDDMAVRASARRMQKLVFLCRPRRHGTSDSRITSHRPGCSKGSGPAAGRIWCEGVA